MKLCDETLRHPMEFQPGYETCCLIPYDGQMLIMHYRYLGMATVRTSIWDYRPDHRPYWTPMVNPAIRKNLDAGRPARDSLVKDHRSY